MSASPPTLARFAQIGLGSHSPYGHILVTQRKDKDKEEEEEEEEVGMNSLASDFSPVGSRAVRIVNPDHPTSPTPTRPALAATATATASSSSSSSSSSSTAATGPPPSRWSRAGGIPAFQPRDQATTPAAPAGAGGGAPPGLSASQTPTPTLTARNVAAPVFVPKQRSQGSSAPPGLAQQQHSQQQHHPQQQQQQQQSSGYPSPVMLQHANNAGPQNPYANNAHHMNPYFIHNQGMSPVAGPPPALGGSNLPMQQHQQHQLQQQQHQHQQQQQQQPYQPPLYHLYAPALPHISNLSPHHFALHSFFMSPALREELQRKNEAIRAAPVPLPDLQPPSSSSSEAAAAAAARGKPLPEELHVYHSLIPLEPLGAAGASLAEIHPALVPGSAGPDAIAAFARGGGGGGGGASSGGLNNNNNGLGISSTSTMSGEPSKVFGYRTHVYRAICKLDGKTYALRRLEGFRLQYEAAIALVERWRRVRHPGVVCVREAFTTRAFSDSSIVFVGDYHPLATNLLQEHLQPKPPRVDPRTNRLQAANMQIPERTMWSYLVQLTGALRAVHRAGLAVRCLEASKVLRTGQNRIRIGGCSIFDVLQFDPSSSGPNKPIARQQADDLLSLGILLLQLGTNSIGAGRDAGSVSRSLEHVGRVYSAEFRDLCAWLVDRQDEGGSPTAQARTVGMLEGMLTGCVNASGLSGGGGASGSGSAGSESSMRSPVQHHPSSSASASAETSSSSWRRTTAAAGGVVSSASTKVENNKEKGDRGALGPNRCAEELDAALNWGDLLEGELMKETENARLVRLVCKLGLINERPEFDHDPRWSETGDRYIIKLFRDFVFHAVDPETGAPVVDLSYILTNLNKLDAGSEEKIVLTSRDEQSCLVVSYRDIKNCIENAFQDLARPR
ncbi:hypothetical protein A4X03_0g6610 [Tilletia caries]|uniref:PAN2-PAN3 deadenylation complex subunit PAN3 n=1 Tax=Tilletia caries TaxID=13290 RepID=A0A177U2H3_9BASI|nr:hypothetical protein A4X03_0g6610 [Tilletia caries]